jgi:5-methylcytosine-specific restriction enzyme subunit McrC
MSSLNKTNPITIYEYGKLERGEPPPVGLPERTFDALEDFILANNSESDTDALSLLSLSARRGRKIITARSYVGLITMKDGTVIEILPKIYGIGQSEDDTKRIFLEMLKTLKNVPFKDFNVSSLKTDRLKNLFEIFISMFVGETAMLLKQGLQASYNSVERNERFFKGKLNVPQDIKHNHINREKFFVRYDEWSLNRPENRLLKATLRFLQKLTRNDRTKLKILHILTCFTGVGNSVDFEADFSKCAVDRSMSHYDKALSWCKIFLRGNSFTAFAGSEIAHALLFPMEKVFESYVATKLLRQIPSDVELRTQDNRYSLFDHPTRAFNLRPDIVLIDGDKAFVMDTKWKMLSENVCNYGISQSDMYQMYAYSKKYKASKIVLIYPQPDTLCSKEFSSDDGVNVEVSFFNLLQPEESLRALIRLAERA